MFWLAAQGTGYRRGGRSHNARLRQWGFASLVRGFRTAGVKPTDIDTVQIYENFTGGFSGARGAMAYSSGGGERVSDAENLVAHAWKLPVHPRRGQSRRILPNAGHGTTA